MIRKNKNAVLCSITGANPISVGRMDVNTKPPAPTTLYLYYQTEPYYVADILRRGALLPASKPGVAHLRAQREREREREGL